MADKKEKKGSLSPFDGLFDKASDYAAENAPDSIVKRKLQGKSADGHYGDDGKWQWDDSAQPASSDRGDSGDNNPAVSALADKLTEGVPKPQEQAPDLEQAVSQTSSNDGTPGLFDSLSAKKDKPGVGFSMPHPPNFHTDIKGNDKGDAEDSGYGDVSDLMASAKTLMASVDVPQEKKDVFADELRQIREADNEARSNLSKRELGHTLAEAITQLAAGAYGVKTKHDMSGLKFDKHDFQKDDALRQQDLQTDLGDLRARREEAAKKEEHDSAGVMEKAKLGFEAAKTSAALKRQDREADQKDIANQIAFFNAQVAGQNASSDTAYKNAMINYHNDMVNANQITDAEKRDEMVNKAFDTAKSAAVDKATKAVMMKDALKNPKQTAAALSTGLSGLGIAPDELEKALNEPKWFGLFTGAKSPEDAALAVNQLIQNVKPPTHTVMMVGSDNKPYLAPNNAAAARMEQSGNFVRAPGK